MTDENIKVDKEDIKKKIPNFVKLPSLLEQEFIEYFYNANILPDKVCVNDRVSLSEEITILATIRVNDIIEYYGFTYNHSTKTVTSQKLK